MISKEDIDFPVCVVCKRRAKQRKLFLIASDLANGKREVCLCSECFFRCPDDLHRQLIRNADSGGGEAFNSMIIKALKNTPSAFELNTGYVLLRNDKVKFDKYTGILEFKKAVTECRRVIVYMFDNGRIIEQLP